MQRQNPSGGKAVEHSGGHKEVRLTTAKFLGGPVSPVALQGSVELRGFWANKQTNKNPKTKMRSGGELNELGQRFELNQKKTEGRET